MDGISYILSSIDEKIFKFSMFDDYFYSQGPEVRGSKPILVCFEKYTDKDDILRKASKLRGTNIYVGEDFSKRVKDQRHELQKFLKAVKRKRPNSTFKMQYDKVINIQDYLKNLYN